MRRVLLTLLLLTGVVAAPAVAQPSASCAALAAKGPQNGHSTSVPPPAPVLFAADFPAPVDCEWGLPLGGWGGTHRGERITHDPVIFVHGNHSDAVDWYGVADAFKAAGYTDQELWAVSYNGLGGQVDGAPIVCPCPPSSRAVAYHSRADVAPYAALGGQYAANTVNVPDLYAFTKTVMAYTGASHVQYVGHSLGVTVIRAMLFQHKELYKKTSAVVSIAGGNHGTSLCRGMEKTLYSCDEVAPGTAWLSHLNAGDETPGPTRYLTIVNADHSFVYISAQDGVLPAVPAQDRLGRPHDFSQSAHLHGAALLEMHGQGGHDMALQASHTGIINSPDVWAASLRFLTAR